MEKILIVSNCPVLTAGIRGILEQAYKNPTITITETYRNIVELGNRDVYQMVIIALEPTADFKRGFIKGLGPTIPVLVISRSTDMKYWQRLYREGVKGFLHLGAATGEFLLAIKELSAGRIYMTESQKRDMLGIQQQIPRYRLNLTKREEEVMRLMLKGLSNSQIGETLMLKPSTVATFKSHILRKTGTRNVLELHRS